MFRTRQPARPRPPESGFTVGEASEALGRLGFEVSPSQIRKLEREGLITIAVRTEGNYRVLDQTILLRIRLILGLRAVGLSLPDIRQVVGLLDRVGPGRAREAREFYTWITGRIDERVRHLQDLKKLLRGDG